MDKRFKLTECANPNYLCTVCKIGEVFPIEGADRLVKTVINGYDIVISKTHKEGDIVVYFPVETSICEQYLSANNLYELSLADKNSNFADVDKLIKDAEAAENDSDAKRCMEMAKSMCGFFNKHGRVRILKLRGQYSQGFVADVSSMVNFDNTLSNVDWESMVGCQFNQVNGIEICKKYIPFVQERREHNHNGGQSLWKKRMKKLKRFNRIRTDQFAYHYDTKMLAEHISQLSPDDAVSITVKVHGTSAIFANVLCNRKLSTWEKIKKFFGAKVQMYEYGNVYSSRSVIKNQYINPNAQSFYGDDIWGCVNKVISPFIEEGLTVYGEIVGYIEGSQKMIQPKHDYGCRPGCWKFMPYRITETDCYGMKVEWDIDKVDEWTRNLVTQNPEIADKIMFLDILYYGRIGDLYPDIDTDTHWHSNLLARMKSDKDKFFMEMDEPMCKNKVPREGIVLRKIGDPIIRAWKLKTLRHYNKEAEAHDKGEADIEETA
jgi:hypothetical protein